MRIGVVWSGPYSRAIAEVLQEYLPKFVPTVTAAMGASDRAHYLPENIDYCTMCFTVSSIKSPWMRLQAGMVMRLTDYQGGSLLFNGLQSHDIVMPSHFGYAYEYQYRYYSHGDLYRMVDGIYDRAPPHDNWSNFYDNFHALWSPFADRLEQAKHDTKAAERRLARRRSRATTDEEHERAEKILDRLHDKHLPDDLDVSSLDKAAVLTLPLCFSAVRRFLQLVEPNVAYANATLINTLCELDVAHVSMHDFAQHYAS